MMTKLLGQGTLSDVFAAALVNGYTGEIVEANNLLCDLLDWTPDELVGKRLDVLIPERSREAHRADQAEFMKHPAPRPMGPDREVFMRKRDGSEVRVWIGLAPAGPGDDDGMVSAVVLSRPMENGSPLNP